MQLVAEGKLTLGDPVERWLPGLVPNGPQITIRQLLSHTSGLYNYTEDPAFDRALISDLRHVWTPRELVTWATAHPPLFAPGTGWSYSNTNYVVLGLVVEAVTGMTLEQQLRQRILQPLALGATALPVGPEIEGRHAHGYVGEASVSGLGDQLTDATDLLGPSWLGAAGGMVSNGDDVTKFFAALLGKRLLPAGLVAAMRTRVRIGRSTRSYGLGLEIEQGACGLRIRARRRLPGVPDDRLVERTRPSSCGGHGQRRPDARVLGRAAAGRPDRVLLRLTTATPRACQWVGREALKGQDCFRTKRAILLLPFRSASPGVAR